MFATVSLLILLHTSPAVWNSANAKLTECAAHFEPENREAPDANPTAVQLPVEGLDEASPVPALTDVGLSTNENSPRNVRWRAATPIPSRQGGVAAHR